MPEDERKREKKQAHSDAVGKQYTAFRKRAVEKIRRKQTLTGVRELYSMAEEGITEADFQTIADVTVDNTGIAFEKYEITKADIIQMLKDSYDSVR